MPSLEELRRFLRGETVEGMPGPSAVGKGGGYRPSDEPHRPAHPDLVAKMRMAKKKASKKSLTKGRVNINADGTDALLRFGKHSGATVSELVRKDISYLRWMLRDGDFSTDLLDVIQYQLELVEDESKAVFEEAKAAGVYDGDSDDLYKLLTPIARPKAKDLKCPSCKSELLLIEVNREENHQYHEVRYHMRFRCVHCGLESASAIAVDHAVIEAAEVPRVPEYREGGK